MMKHYLAALIGIPAALLPVSNLHAEDTFDQLRLERRHTAQDEMPRLRPPVRHAARAPAGVWAVSASADLRQTLEDWCARDGYKLLWQSDFNYQMTSGAAFSGSFQDAVRALIVSMRDVRPAPSAKIYEGNRVLVFSNAGAGATD